MAIIGKFENVMKLLQNCHGFNIMKDYLSESMILGSETNSRLHGLPVGTFERFELRDGYYAVEQKFLSKPRENCFFESHIKHIDIQLMVDGEELMETLDFSRVNLNEDHSSERDLLVYGDCLDSHKMLLSSSYVAVFFPEDVHMGTQMYNTPKICIKTVVKMPVAYFKI